MHPIGILLATGADGRWRIGIGDPSVFGWVAVAGYFAAALLCWRASTAARRLPCGVPRTLSLQRRVVWFWRALVLVMAALGVNKQLDLQSLFTEIGRAVALSQGWYGRRHVVQLAFVIGLGGVGILGAGLLAYWLRGVVRQVLGPALGVTALFVFVVIRAASFHRVDFALMSGSARLNGVLELGGIALVAAFAVHSRRRDERIGVASAATRP